MIFDSGLVILPAGIVGYAAGFLAQRKIDRRIVPAVLLTLAISLFAIWLFQFGRGDQSHADLVWMQWCSFTLAVCGAASAGWVFTRQPGIAFAISSGLTLLAAYMWLELALQRICGVPGGCGL